mmetsp:Transcript_19099/g.56230  ORF Transcript_19099/g.56230 Transcript_19099/m.56230 type:complete len:236 (+) Transcript_19099:2961-3668(+)
MTQSCRWTKTEWWTPPPSPFHRRRSSSSACRASGPRRLGMPSASNPASSAEPDLWPRGTTRRARPATPALSTPPLVRTSACAAPLARLSRLRGRSSATNAALAHSRPSLDSHRASAVPLERRATRAGHQAAPSAQLAPTLTSSALMRVCRARSRRSPPSRAPRALTAAPVPGASSSPGSFPDSSARRAPSARNAKAGLGWCPCPTRGRLTFKTGTRPSSSAAPSSRALRIRCSSS